MTEEKDRMGTFASASAQCKGALGRQALLSDRGHSCTIKLESDVELRCHSTNKYLKVFLFSCAVYSECPLSALSLSRACRQSAPLFFLGFSFDTAQVGRKL